MDEIILREGETREDQTRPDAGVSACLSLTFQISLPLWAAFLFCFWQQIFTDNSSRRIVLFSREDLRPESKKPKSPRVDERQSFKM